MKHKHADLMAAYAADAQTTEKPWELWESSVNRHSWFPLIGQPTWSTESNYRRKPVQHTIVLNTEQLKEVIMACSNVGWENEDFATGVQVLQNALGVQPVPKTNAQIVCEKLRKAYDDLEEHSAIICEPNVDHIQKLVWDSMKLLEVTK